MLIISKIEDFETDQKFNLIYFDAFDPVSQPELWSISIFEKLHQMMENDAILTTYCCKSMVQKNLKNAGFEIEKHPGPPRKREVLRAIRK
jgi:tRNA U34 5-methylaminomethyl-2-thiouridine-forming methyltransferase MnmC